MKVLVYENPQELAGAAAADFVRRANEAIESRGRFAVALAGGSTPRATYELLASDYADALDWSRVHIFFGDERGVPPDHEDSNYRMAHDALLSHVPVGGVHRMRGELPPEEAAAAYEEELRKFFGAVGFPTLDLIMLGTGEDGHTASLFPDTPALDERERWAVANPVEKLGTTRITLTSPVINASRAVSFLVAGEGKAEAMREILEGNGSPRQYPAKLIQPDGELTWMLDRAAAKLLEKPL